MTPEERLETIAKLCTVAIKAFENGNLRKVLQIIHTIFVVATQSDTLLENNRETINLFLK